MVRIKYTSRLLADICERDKCIIELQDYKDVCNRNQLVKFVCKCGQHSAKVFREMNGTGAFCKACMKIVVKERTRQTNMQKYGVVSHNQCEAVKAKKQQTCLNNHGVLNPSQSQAIQKHKKENSFEKHGVSHPALLQTVQEKKKQTCLQKYGVVCSLQAQEVKEKIVATNIEKYGVSYPMQSEEVREKAKQTYVETLGVEHPSQSIVIKEKKKQTCLKHLGVEHPSQSEHIKQKKRNTCLLNHGVEYPTQSPNVMNKQVSSRYRRKIYIFPCGETRTVQGYEHYALDILVNLGYEASDIITDCTKVPEVWYKHPKRSSLSRYHCDIFIPKENKIIEVKSTYTLDSDHHVNVLKAEACKTKGYAFDFWVFNDKGELLEYSIEGEAMSMTANDVLFDMLVNVLDSSEERVLLTWYLGFLFKEFLVECDSSDLCQVISEFATYRQSPEGKDFLNECIMMLKEHDNSTYKNILDVVSSVQWVEDK